MSEQSEQIDKLASALAKAQGKITGALKDSKNPFFKSNYADLASCWDACRAPLSENELAVLQTTEVDAEGVTVVTTLAHASGQWVRSKLRMIPKDASPQSTGSVLTYARRYALAAIVGLAQVDDDANAASHDPRGEQPTVSADEVHKYESRFRDALDADVDESAKAELVYKVHLDICNNEPVYIAVADALGSKLKRAIREYVTQAKSIKGGVMQNGRAAA